MTHETTVNMAYTIEKEIRCSSVKIKIQGDAHHRLPRLMAGVCLVAVLGLAAAWVRNRHSERQATLRAEARQPERVVPARAETAKRPSVPRAARGSVLGRFEVPALQMSWEVLEGTDDKTLERSIGHVAGTAGLGEAGNIGIAGHRNTHFRKIEWIRRGDEIVLTTKDGTFRYRVDYVKLHKPTDVHVLDDSLGPAVTLVTCFPFEYVGSAPLRYIVRAVAVEESRTRLLARVAKD